MTITVATSRPKKKKCRLAGVVARGAGSRADRLRGVGTIDKLNKRRTSRKIDK